MNGARFPRAAVFCKKQDNEREAKDIFRFARA
jgi:hypothetical protein